MKLKYNKKIDVKVKCTSIKILYKNLLTYGKRVPFYMGVTVDYYTYDYDSPPKEISDELCIEELQKCATDPTYFAKNYTRSTNGIKNYFDDVRQKWIPQNDPTLKSWSTFEYGIHSVKSFKRYLKKNKHNFRSGTVVTLVAKYHYCNVIGKIK